MATRPLFPTWPPSCPPGETWELDGGRGLRTESRGCQSSPDSLPSSHGQMGAPGPSSSSPGFSRLYKSPNRHCERKTAGHEQTRYLFSHNLWAGVATGQESHPSCILPCSTHAVPSTSWYTCSLSPSPSVTFLDASLVLPVSLPASSSLLAPPRLCHHSGTPRSTWACGEQ